MDVDLLLDDQEQAILDVARDLLSRRATPALVREMERDPIGYPPGLWREIAQLDWIGLSLPEAYGGQGMPLSYSGLLLEEIGRHVAPLPLHSTLTAALTIARHGTDTQCAAILPAVCRGDAVLTVAFQEGPKVFGAVPRMTAARDGEHFVLTGTKRFVDNASIASHCLVACATDAGGEQTTMFLVDLASPGISRDPLVTLAKDRQSTVRFDAVRVPADAIIGEYAHGAPILDDMIDLGAALLAAQMAGATRRDAEFALEHSRNRVAFGRPIGAFQSIQHLSADMRILTDGVQMLTREAIWRLGEGLPASVEVSQAKAFANDKCVFVVRSSQQIHGGIGFMMEFDLHLWYRRVVAWSLRYGTAAEHRARVASALLDTPGPVRLGATQRLPG